MKNLIPYFIAEKYKKRQYKGLLNGVALFVDVSGFTSVTNELMKNDKEGAEIMSRIINSMFEPSVDYIYRNKGFVTHFAGDAFVAVFPIIKRNTGRSAKAAFSSAIAIRDLFIQKGRHKTKFGCFDLSIKIGISAGNIEWGIIKNPEQNAYYFRGSAIDGSAKCEKICSINSIVFDKSISINTGFSGAEFSKIKKDFYELKSVQIPKELKDKIKPSRLEIQRKFYDETVLKKPSQGEFREVVSCFISFNPEETSENTIKVLINNARKFGGYFNNINYGDKGAFALVFFGIPYTREGFVQSACDFLLSLKKIDGFGIKAGATLGKVYSGFRGSSKRAEYVCLGSAVNLAARLMVVCETGKILVDSTFKEMTSKFFIFGNKTLYKLKGFDEHLFAHNLRGKRKKAVRIEFSPSFFGREKELQKMLRTARRVTKKRDGWLFFVHGEAGIGKTRTIEEFCKSVKNDYQILRMIPDKIVNTSLNPFYYALKEYFCQNSHSSKKDNLSSFNEIFKRLSKNIDGQVSFDLNSKDSVNEFKNTLANILGLIDEKPINNSETAPEIHHKRVLGAIDLFFRQVFQSKPTILIAEDFHFYDIDSTSLLTKISKYLEHNNVILIVISRNQNDLIPFRNFSDRIKPLIFNMKALDEKSQEKMIDSLIRLKINTEFTLTIKSKCGGNPFFIEQYTRFLVNNRCLDEKSFIDTIPSNINEIIITRFDSLDKKLQFTAASAAVLGVEFETDILKSIVDKNRLSDFDSVLQMGKKENIWTEVKTGTFRFTHVLLQENFYELQSKKLLRRRHFITGKHLSGIYTNNPNKYAEIAFHFERSEKCLYAKKFLDLAANRAIDIYDNTNAVNLLGRLLKITNKEKKRLDIKVKLADTYFKIGEYNKSEEIYIKIISSAKRIKYNAVLALSYKNIGYIYINKGFYDRAMTFYEKAKKIYSIEKNDSGISRIILNVSNYHLKKNNIETAKNNYLKCLKMISYEKDLFVEASCYEGLAWVNFFRRDFVKAEKYFRRALSFFSKMKDQYKISRVLHNIAYTLIQTDKLEEAEKLLFKCKNICIKTGHKEQFSHCIETLGILDYKRGDYIKAIEKYSSVLDISDEMEDISLKCHTHFNLGLCFYRLHDYPNAHKHFSLQKKNSKVIGDKTETYRATKHIGLVHEKKGEYEKSLRCYRFCLKYSFITDDISRQSTDLNNIGEILFMQKDFTSAEKYFHRAQKKAFSCGNKNQLCITLKNRAKVLFFLSKFKQSEEINVNGRDKLSQKWSFESEPL